MKRLYRILFVLTLFTLTGCNKEDDSISDNKDFASTRVAILEQLADGLIIPGYEDLGSRSDALVQSITDFQNDPNESLLVETQAKLKEAYLAWHKVGAFQFGPSENSDVLLVNNFNIYPTDTTKIWELANEEAPDIEIKYTAKGLPALEYIFHGVGIDNATIVSSLKTNTQLVTYALLIAKDLQTRVNKTQAKWNDSYKSDFIASSGTDIGSSLSIFYNAYLKYFERNIRDGQLAIPAGIRSFGAIKPDRVESRYAGNSLLYVQTALESCSNIFTGTSLDGKNGIGLDDYVSQLQSTLDGEPLVTEILSRIEKLNKALDEVNSPIDELVQNDNATAQQIFGLYQDVIFPLKVDVTSEIGISVTYADNDGD